jgi:hypothetical protein
MLRAPLRPPDIESIMPANLFDCETTERTEYTEKRLLSSVYSVCSVVFHLSFLPGTLASILVLASPLE